MTSDCTGHWWDALWSTEGVGKLLGYICHWCGAVVEVKPMVRPSERTIP